MQRHLQKIVDYIEENINEPLNAEIIASFSGFSKSYLHKIFYIYTGINLIEYVRNRKLDFAMNDLKSNLRIIDIALNYGYSSERSFSRAFIKRFNCSPSNFRNNPLQIKGKLIIKDLNILKKGFKEEFVMLEYLSEVKFQVIEKMIVLSSTIISENPEDQVIELIHKFSKDNNIKCTRAFGFDSPVTEEEHKKGYRGYEYWLVVDEKEINRLFKNEDIFYNDIKITKKVIKSYNYACLRIDDPFSNPFSKIPNGWKYLLSWLEENKTSFKTDNNICANCLEEVKEVNKKTVMDIYIPINKI